MLQSGHQQGTETARYHTQKKTKRYKEQSPEKVKAYQDEIRDIAVEKRVYVDETGFQTYYDREYGYAPKGEQIFGKVAGRKYKRSNLVAAKIGNHMIAPLSYQQNTDAETFETWFEDQLLPRLSPGHVVIMDNASFHRKTELNGIAAAHQIRVLFLPPYSPEYNPIEKLWANIKRWLRKNMRNYSSFDDALRAAIEFCS